MSKRLPDNCLSLYADLLQKTIASQHAVLNGGSFVSKSIKGAVYWYYQTKIVGQTKQKYLGRESESLLQEIEQAKAQGASLKAILSERQRLHWKKAGPQKYLSAWRMPGSFHLVAYWLALLPIHVTGICWAS
jgi:hypothetical protein